MGRRSISPERESRSIPAWSRRSNWLRSFRSKQAKAAELWKQHNALYVAVWSGKMPEARNVYRRECLFHFTRTRERRCARGYKHFAALGAIFRLTRFTSIKVREYGKVLFFNLVKDKATT